MKRFLLALLLCAAALPAYAQIGPSVGGPGGGYGGVGGNGYGGGGTGLPNRNHGQDDDSSRKGAEEKPVAPPPAIPGAQPDSDAAVIPADKVAAEMSPNEALFDAINRGDLAAAKDAVNRGAQLDAHNVLGQTPTDAAIDLSRNDITFLLLSLRGSVSSGKPVQTVAAQAGKPARGSKVTRVAAQHAAPVHVATTDRGTPNPAVGFNGF